MRTIHSFLIVPLFVTLFTGFLLPVAASAGSEKELIGQIIALGDEQMMAGARLVYASEKAEPDERSGLMASAAKKFDAGFGHYEKALDRLKKSNLNHFVKLDMTWPIYFNMAAARSLQQRKDEAIDYMGRMMSAGFDLWHLLPKEHDFDNIRNEPEYKRMVSLAKDAELVRRYFADWLLKDEAMFPYNLQLTTTSGKKLSLADLKGKVVIINFWGTWYEPWETEPQILDWIESSFDGRVVVLGLAWQQGMDADTAAATLAEASGKTGIHYPLAIIDKKMTATVPDFLSWPTTLFIDRKGRVRYKADGAMDQASHWMLARLLDAEAP